MDHSRIKILFCPLGQDLPSVRRKILTKRALSLGVSVVEEFRQATHIVISRYITSLGQVSKKLNVDENELKRHIELRKVKCVLPDWVAVASGQRLATPSRKDIWPGFILRDPKKRRREASERNVEQKQRKFSKNLEIAAVFKQLSGLHQSCPLLPMDSWKAYCFRVVSGRIMNLDFEIADDSDILEKLRAIKGIGSGSFDKITEYLSTGTLSRIQEFQTDPRRVAMKNMMDIWGVGRVKASELVHRGFSTIEEVRRGIQQKELFLDRNQLVGVDCYEDIVEEMARDEVDALGGLVKESVELLYPGAQVTIMGSYRRGKNTCGDVDVHITHGSFVKKIPVKALGKIVDLLWQNGHVAFHLTLLSGMTTGNKLEDYMRSGKSMPRDAWKWSKAVKHSYARSNEKSASYMGVFNSPLKKGKRRRIDIKFYPYRERIFASLYFTGNGYFNRSMRLWAHRRFGFSLNDHGLFLRGTSDRVMEASKESDVFDKLQLVYKKPHERDCFDAVEPVNGTLSSSDIEMTEAELLSDERQNEWVD